MGTGSQVALTNKLGPRMPGVRQCPWLRRQDGSRTDAARSHAEGPTRRGAALRADLAGMSAVSSAGSNPAHSMHAPLRHGSLSMLMILSWKKLWTQTALEAVSAILVGRCCSLASVVTGPPTSGTLLTVP